MSILAQATSGKQIGPQIHVIAGINGVGKTTWAASFPNAIVIDLEKGSEHINVSRVTSSLLPDFATFRLTLKELATAKHSYKTVVIDSVEALEGLINDAVCIEGKVKSIEDYGAGYGKGYTRARELMREVIGDLREFQKIGITTILVGHTQVKTHTDPATNQTYDRVVMRCNDKMASLIRDMADNVFYASYKVFTTEKNKKTQAFGDGQRVLYCQSRPGFDAKNRLDLPLEIPLSYEAFLEACGKSDDTVLSDIEQMSEKLNDQLRAKIKDQVSKNKTNPAKLKEIKNRLMTYVSAQGA